MKQKKQHTVESLIESGFQQSRVTAPKTFFVRNAGRAANNPKRKMALIFRSYLGLSSRWSNAGEKGREMDYQIWCGPAMGAFNSWVKNSYLAEPKNRSVVDIAHHIMTGSAYLYRLQNLKLQGISIPAKYWNYRPDPLCD